MILAINCASKGMELPVSGHMEIANIIPQIKKSFIWYGLSREVDLLVKSCNICKNNKTVTVKPKSTFLDVFPCC